ncbi:MAG: polysaccharide deacetylase family protein [Acidobacteriota bacterium]|nr:polysaccharide deacetylase family protein [Acidobacteriota bacterium]
MNSTAFSLMYHDVVPAGQFESSGMSGAGARVYKVEQAEFIAHLDAIGGLGMGGVGLRAGDECGGLCPVYLTFDDGGSSAAWIASELDRRGWKGHFFVVSDWIGRAGFLSAAELREMAARGHVIGSHSCSHPPRLSALPPDEIGRQWKESVEALSDIVGGAVTVASVPGGFYSTVVGEAAERAGIRHLFTSEPASRWERLGTMRLLGRYHVQRGTAVEEILSFAGGRDSGPRRRQAFSWTLRKAAKSLFGGFYEQVRLRLIRP